jgi:quinoprotein glucose dehydrogenase
LIAIDLDSGSKLWERTLGNLHGLAPLVGDWLDWGTPNSGGSLQTGGGLVFISATMDKYLRAFDTDTGTELWRYELPYAGNATPISYRTHPGGKQFLVIAAGGHAALGTQTGDAIVAFTLP